MYRKVNNRLTLLLVFPPYFIFQGKVKSIYENIKNFIDPTPRFDSHIGKNAGKATSLTSYRAFEYTQVDTTPEPLWAQGSSTETAEKHTQVVQWCPRAKVTL